MLLGNGLTQNFGCYNWNEKVNNVGQGGRLDMTVTGTGAYNEASKSFANTFLKNSYSYDSVCNISSIYDSVWGETQTFGYDELNRLPSASATDGQANYNETYQYDPSTGNLMNKNGLVLNYPAANAARPHAVTSAGNNTYGYDDNGNQTSRNIGGNNYTLGYDAENRLVSVTGIGGTTTSAHFTYNGDGQKVKSVINGETTLLIGGHFEKKGSEITKYYFAGASRIAMRKYTIPQSMMLEYLLAQGLRPAPNRDRRSPTHSLSLATQRDHAPNPSRPICIPRRLLLIPETPSDTTENISRAAQ
jgi:YD repeat-containing protein